MKKIKSTLFIFGSGECGQLPPEYCTEYVQLNPTAVKNLPDNIDEVICGSMHTIIKTRDDKLYSFGCNDMGVLGRKTYGNSTKDPEHSPTLINFECSSRIKKITCGDNHTAILLENGKVYITGGFRDSCGILGLPSFEKENHILPKSDAFIEVKFNFSNHRSSCLQKSNNFEGDQHSGSSGNSGNSGDGDRCALEQTEAQNHPSKEVKIINIISGEDHLICLEESHEYIFTMGNSDSCQVCNTFYEQENSQEEREKYIFPNCYHYKDFGFDTKFKNIYCGGNNTFVQLDISLDVYAIGRNAYGSCGVSLKDNIIKHFEKIKELCSKEINQLCGGQSFTVCLLKNNDMYIWGNREILGMKCDDDAYTPLELFFFKKRNYTIKTIYCGTDHCLVLTEDGKLFGWGTGGNDFDQDTCIGVIEKNYPSEINFASFVNKTFFKSSENSDVLMNQIRIISFAGGSSHCAFISSHIIDSERVPIKRGYDELYDDNILIKKQKRESNLDGEGENGMLANAERKNKKSETVDAATGVATGEAMGVATGEAEEQKSKVSFFKDLYLTPQMSINKIFSPSKEEFQSVENQNVGSVEKDKMNSEQNKRRRSTKSKPYLSNESPTRRQPRRSCKENISLSEKSRRQFYQIVDTPISKRKRKTTSSLKTENSNSKTASNENKKSKSVGMRRESVGRSYSKRENQKRESAAQTPDMKFVRGKSSKVKN
ncbi:regulator of chromosome condensation, putative [Plasmodium ovale]|uniref:Regulator of chromosome condensation, putative n=1 Tax=Plasmodium ovale TaxID=36330 RepID=A0A1C3KME5_PLAOA|nr:regulator of chromosome condensation, putative [Plasmodium ovale]